MSLASRRVALNASPEGFARDDIDESIVAPGA
jgi:hypothetical protein